MVGAPARAMPAGCGTCGVRLGAGSPSHRRLPQLGCFALSIELAAPGSGAAAKFGKAAEQAGGRLVGAEWGWGIMFEVQLAIFREKE
jgi:hypothetical protein